MRPVAEQIVREGGGLPPLRLEHAAEELLNLPEGERWHDCREQGGGRRASMMGSEGNAGGCDTETERQEELRDQQGPRVNTVVRTAQGSSKNVVGCVMNASST